MRVLCVGGANVDYCGRASVELAAGQSAPGRVTRRIGGVAVNVALGVREIARMAGRTGEVGVDMGTVVGDDPDGQGVVGHLRAHDIGTDMVVTREGGCTGAYLAIQDTRGQTMLGIGDTRGVESLTAGEARDIGEAGTGYDVLFIDCNIPAGRLESIVDSASGGVTGRGGDERLSVIPYPPRKPCVYGARYPISILSLLTTLRRGGLAGVMIWRGFSPTSWGVGLRGRWLPVGVTGCGITTRRGGCTITVLRRRRWSRIAGWGTFWRRGWCLGCFAINLNRSANSWVMRSGIFGSPMGSTAVRPGVRGRVQGVRGFGIMRKI